MGEILCVLMANVLGFGTAYFVESKVQHLYKSSIKWIRYLNYFSFLFIGIGLVKIFNEFLRVVVLQQSVRIGEIVNGIAIFILIWPVTLFLISFAISKLKNSQSVQVDINADVVEVVDVTNALQANSVVTSNTKDFAVKTLIVTLSIVVILSLVAYLFNVTKSNKKFFNY